MHGDHHVDDKVSKIVFLFSFQLEAFTHDDDDRRQGLGPGDRQDVRVGQNGREVRLPNVSRMRPAKRKGERIKIWTLYDRIQRHIEL